VWVCICLTEPTENTCQRIDFMDDNTAFVLAMLITTIYFYLVFSKKPHDD
jgi:hypothetical protein